MKRYIGIDLYTDSFTAFLGMTPSVSQSDNSMRVGRITKRGSKIVRTTLVQCALIAMRTHCHAHSLPCAIAPLPARLLRARQIQAQSTDKAIIAVARKLLNTIFYTLKNNWVFEDFPNFVIKPCNQS